MILSLITYPLSPKIKPIHQVYTNVSKLTHPPWYKSLQIFITYILMYICYLESPNMQVDTEGKKVRPAHTRCSTVIIREKPIDTQSQEIKVNKSVTFFVWQLRYNELKVFLEETHSDTQLKEIKVIYPVPNFVNSSVQFFLMSWNILDTIFKSEAFL